MSVFKIQLFLMSDSAEILFSIIVPVYNRADEMAGLLRSLVSQTDSGFEAVVVEDGSTMPCRDVCTEYAAMGVRVSYYYKENEGRSIARNYGMERAAGQYFVFVDSDCVLPDDYIASLRRSLVHAYTDCFGGPDAAHSSFSTTQKAISYAMTSFLTTGGIRGGKVQLEKFVPRTFNMGFSRRVYQDVGGFREMFSEDIDMSTRIRLKGYGIALLRDVRVYHRRRVDMLKFWRQVHIFGMSRITLKILYPDSLKMVHTLPALFVVASVAMILSAFLVSWLCILPLAVYLLAVWIAALATTRSFIVGCKAVVASVIQLWGYGTGFIRAFVWKILLGHGRDVADEIERRRGK